MRLKFRRLLRRLTARRKRVLAGRYILLDEDGLSGGMGTVYRARDVNTGQIVAVKILHPHLARDPRHIQQFQREVDIAMALESDEIARTLDYGEDSGRHFLTMEFVDGASLAHYLEDPLSPEETIAIAVPVARALAHAHSRGVLHRDIRPENVIIGTKSPRIVDFGISQVVDYTLLPEVVQRGPSGRPPGIVGVVQYMAPELFEEPTSEADRDASKSGASDVYSVGIMLYEMLSGAAPFVAGSFVDVVQMHLTVVPDSLPNSVPTDFGMLIMRCLEKRASHRFKDGAALRDALQSLDCTQGSHLPPHIPGPWPRLLPTWQRLARVSSRHKAAVVVLAVAAMAVLATGTILLATVGPGDRSAPADTASLPLSAIPSSTSSSSSSETDAYVEYIVQENDTLDSIVQQHLPPGENFANYRASIVNVNRIVGEPPAIRAGETLLLPRSDVALGNGSITTPTLPAQVAPVSSQTARPLVPAYWISVRNLSPEIGSALNAGDVVTAEVEYRSSLAELLTVRICHGDNTGFDVGSVSVQPGSSGTATIVVEISSEVLLTGVHARATGTAFGFGNFEAEDFFPAASECD